MRFLSTLLASTLGALVALGIVFFFGFLFLIGLAASADDTPRVRSGSVLRMELSGAIPELTASDPLAEAFGDAPSVDLRDVKAALRKAAVDDRIEGVWLELAPLSVPWATLQEVRHALLEYQESGKPLYATGEGDYMNEAQYFLATAADSVFIRPATLFEFNGFYINVEFYHKLLERLNIEPQIVRAGRFKSAVEPYQREDLSPENREQLSAILGRQNEVFLEAVAQSRAMTTEAVQEILSERAIVSAEDGLAAGLLDGLLFEDEVQALFKERLGVEEDDDLRTIGLRSYARVPASEAGLEVGDDEGEVAIVYAVGAIMPGESQYSPNPFLGGEVLGAETFNAAMRRAREDDDVKAVVLRIDSPGGAVGASEAMRHEIELTVREKPVIVSMGDVAASGGYWIATPADTIVADPLTLTGSIGVFFTFFDAGDFFEEKLGITYDGVRTSPYADLYSALRPFSEEERALLQSSVDDTYQKFISLVAESRGVDVAQIDSVGQGRVWTGLQAKELGLVDELGGLGRAVEMAAERAGLAEGAYRVRVLPRPKTFLERFSESLEARAEAAWLKVGTSPAERALLEQARFMQRLAAEHGTLQARLPMTIEIR